MFVARIILPKMREDVKLLLSSIPLQDFIINAEDGEVVGLGSVFLTAATRQSSASGKENSKGLQRFSKNYNADPTQSANENPSCRTAQGAIIDISS